MSAPPQTSWCGPGGPGFRGRLWNRLARFSQLRESGRLGAPLRAHGPRPGSRPSSDHPGTSSGGGAAGWSQEGPNPGKSPTAARPGPARGTPSPGLPAGPLSLAPGPAPGPAPARTARPLPNRPRRGLARQRAHLRGAPSRPPPARSAVPAPAPTRSLRSPRDVRALRTAKQRQWRRRPEKGRPRRRGRCAASWPSAVLSGTASPAASPRLGVRQRWTASPGR